jgi:alpha-D-xyloside xylohydrolase
MVIAFSNDTACKYLDQQYMLGDNLLIVPVMNEEGLAEFYVPEGIWYDVVTNDTYEGGRYYQRKCDYYQMPILARPNSIVTYGEFATNNVVYDYLQNAEVTIYSLEDGKTAAASIYDSEANKLTDLTAERSGNTITVNYGAVDKSFKVVVAGTGKSAVAEAGSTSLQINI